MILLRSLSAIRGFSVEVEAEDRRVEGSLVLFVFFTEDEVVEDEVEVEDRLVTIAFAAAVAIDEVLVEEIEGVVEVTVVSKAP